QRLFTGPRRRAIVLRDKGCTFPGCDRPASWSIVHHLTPWWLGGPTDRNNSALVCDSHHRVIHQGEWTVHIAADGHQEFLPPPWVDPDRRPQRNRRHESRATAKDRDGGTAGSATP
ncbi:MAG: HNH endonuclease, partial [Geodermatophilaceae bacterium]|nr:HNH endonuclease [Geodermatophilaceae bacterium]